MAGLEFIRSQKITRHEMTMVQPISSYKALFEEVVMKTDQATYKRTMKRELTFNELQELESFYSQFDFGH